MLNKETMGEQNHVLFFLDVPHIETFHMRREENFGAATPLNHAAL
ncbi:MAG: hypothetical protein ACE3JK_04140 [Sporolactobacillus sp.]